MMSCRVRKLAPQGLKIGKYEETRHAIKPKFRNGEILKDFLPLTFLTFLLNRKISYKSGIKI